MSSPFPISSTAYLSELSPRLGLMIQQHSETLGPMIAAMCEQGGKVLKSIDTPESKKLFFAVGVLATLQYGVPFLGFGSAGIAAGSPASWYQSTFLGAYTPAPSAFSVLQSWGATGYLTTVTNGVSVAGVPVAGAWTWAAKGRK